MIVLFSQLFFETRLVLHNECSLSDYSGKDGKFLIISFVSPVLTFSEKIRTSH